MTRPETWKNTADPTEGLPSCALPGEVTTRGAQGHARRGERPCELCRLARNAYKNEYYHQGPLKYGPNVLRINARQYRRTLRDTWREGYSAAKLGRKIGSNPYDTAEVTG